MTRLRPYVSRLTAAGLGLALAACAVQGPAVDPRKPAATTKPRASTAPTGAPSAGGLPTTATAPPAAGLAKLLRPAAGTTPLRGRVTIEASYALGAGGTLISDKGAGVVANNGGSIGVGGARLDAASGRLVSNNGGSVLADGAGHVAADAPGGRAPELAGGALLAGGAVVANNGAGMNGSGAGMVSNGSSNYAALPAFRLAQATAPAAGTELPAAGMLVSVVSLADHRYVPLGERADGSAIYAVYTDVAGGFEVHVPAGGGRNLLVVASVPGGADRRLNPNVVVASGTADLTVDELERLTTQYLRLVFTQQMAIALRTPDLALGFVTTENYLAGDPEDPATSRGVVVAMLRELGELGREAGLPADPEPARLEAACRRVVDALLARVDLPKAAITAADVPKWVLDGGAARPPLALTTAFRQILRTLLDGAGARLRTAPTYYDQAFLEGTINATSPEEPMGPIGDWTGRITTPGDVAEFMLVEYAGAVRFNANVGYRRLYRDFHAALGAQDPTAAANESAIVLQSAGYGVIVALARVLTGDAAAAAEVRAILAEEAGGAAP